MADLSNFSPSPLYTPPGSGTGTIQQQLDAAAYGNTLNQQQVSTSSDLTPNMWGAEQGALASAKYSTNLQAQAQNDPWSFYRASSADNLAKQASQPDPSQAFQTQLTNMMTGNFSPSDPSYQFRFQQGQQALERSEASKGMLGSGNAALELQQYGQGAASQEYQAQFTRLLQGMQGVESTYNTQQSRLMELAGVQTPGVQSGINAGITTAGISANASMSNNAANNNTAQMQMQLDQQNNLQNQAGIAAGLGIDTSGGAPTNTTFSPNWGFN